jgi:hypothetical protein
MEICESPHSGAPDPSLIGEFVTTCQPGRGFTRKPTPLARVNLQMSRNKGRTGSMRRADRRESGGPPREQHVNDNGSTARNARARRRSRARETRPRRGGSQTFPGRGPDTVRLDFCTLAPPMGRIPAEKPGSKRTHPREFPNQRPAFSRAPGAAPALGAGLLTSPRESTAGLPGATGRPSVGRGCGVRRPAHSARSAFSRQRSNIIRALGAGLLTGGV